MEKSVVIFRKFKSDGSIIALFPYEIDNRIGHCNSYMHIGQHSGADYDGLIECTVLATPEEYSDLSRELSVIGYSFEIAKKRSRNLYSNALRKFKEDQK